MLRRAPKPDPRLARRTVATPQEEEEEWLKPKDLVSLFAYAERRWRHSNRPFPMFEQDDEFRARFTVAVERDAEVAFGPYRVWPPPPIWEPDVLVGLEVGTTRLALDDPTPNPWRRDEPTERTEPEEVIQMQTFTVVERPTHRWRTSASEWDTLATAVIETAKTGKAVRMTFDSIRNLQRARQYCYMRCRKVGVAIRSRRPERNSLAVDLWAEPKRTVVPFQPAGPPDPD
mgnify:CR=1 FL=1